MANIENNYSASASALGYAYQQRYALYWLLSSPEDAECQIECLDDIDINENGSVALGSLKHRIESHKLSDLDKDFWKSVRIWLEYYQLNPIPTNKCRFCLVTTSLISDNSVLRGFLDNGEASDDLPSVLIEKAKNSKNELIKEIGGKLDSLETKTRDDFFSRITIFDSEPRIEDLPLKIQNTFLRTVRSKYRAEVYQKLEGWWFDLTIKMMAKQRNSPISGMEVSEMLANYSSEFHDDNLPVSYETAEPNQEPDSENDQRNFVKQLRSIGIGADRIRRAILDYYRASEQRSEWIRIDLQLNGELGQYDDRLVEEWDRERVIVWDDITETSSEENLKLLGKRLLNQILRKDSEHLRIRPRVFAPFVMQGSYHILANDIKPKVHWHPKFNERVNQIFEKTEK